MTESISEPSPEAERQLGLNQLIEQYLPEDKEFIDDMDEADKLGFIYGQLLETGEDPDVILHEFGVTERIDEV